MILTELPLYVKYSGKFQRSHEDLLPIKELTCSLLYLRILLFTPHLKHKVQASTFPFFALTTTHDFLSCELVYFSNWLTDLALLKGEPYKISTPIVSLEAFPPCTPFHTDCQTNDSRMKHVYLSCPTQVHSMVLHYLWDKFYDIPVQHFVFT